jgi:tetratricopeptide (TPR) repeat protein
MNRFAQPLARILVWSVIAVSAASAFQKQPAPKSQKELDALRAMFNAKTDDEKIQTAETLLTTFADTDFKSLALFMEAEAYSRKQGSFEKAIVYGERSLEADPKNYQAMLLLATQYAGHTGENDLDKEEKLTKATKYANDAMGVIAAAPKPNPQITEDQWNAAKKDLTGQAHEALGMIADVRKKYDVASTEYKTAIDGSATPNPATMVRFAIAQERLGKWDEAIATLDKVINDPNSHPVVKQVATAEKTKATNGKNAVKK